MDEEGLGTDIKNLKAPRILQAPDHMGKLLQLEEKKPPASEGSDANNWDPYLGTGRRVGRDENWHKHEAEAEIARK